MQRLNLTLLLVLDMALLTIGCGGSTADETDGGVSGAGGNTAGVGGGGATGGGTGASCDVVSATAAQVNLCQEATNCAKTECTGDLATCLGSGYSSGIYAGASCSAYANCVKTCNCVSSCISSTCAFDQQTCGTCLLNHLGVCVAQGTCAPIAAKCLFGG